MDETEDKKIEETVVNDSEHRENEFDDLRDRVAELSDKAQTILMKLDMLDDIMTAVASLTVDAGASVTETVDTDGDGDDDAVVTVDGDVVDVDTPLEDLDFTLD